MTDRNLYQVIGVSETASVQEIEAAAIKRYNETRNLVNHYSPEIATNATQELNKIEQARTILLDPVKKLEYDQILGIASGVGGLADPSQTLGTYTNLGAPPVSHGVSKPQTPQVLQPQQQAVDQLVSLNAWVCSKCHTPNPKGTKFCKKCGNEVGINCPNCGKLVEASADRCTECGIVLDQVLKQIEMENTQRIQEQMRIQPILAEMEKQSSSALKLTIRSRRILGVSMLIIWIFNNSTVLGVCFLLSLVALFLLISGYKKAVSVLNMRDIDSPLAVTYKEKAMKARSSLKAILLSIALYIVFILIWRGLF